MATDGDDRPMDSTSGTTSTERPADEYSRLWEPGAAVPDVFAFLAAHADIPVADRLDVLLVDQNLRWLRNQPLPLRIYLSAFPDIAERGELIRTLVNGERQARRRSSGRLNDTLTEPSPAASHSETPTEAAAPPADRGPDARDRDPVAPPIAAATTASMPAPPVPLATTKIPNDGEFAGDSGDLVFDLDERHHLRSEAETLRAMLDTVRFTLVRRVGTGGMGVVYEAYDRKRGELVALKTMRRADPSALARFKQEFRSLADITHPNLVNLYELFAVDDRWFFTMELVEGSDFLRYVRSRPSADPVDLGPPSRPPADPGGNEPDPPAAPAAAETAEFVQGARSFGLDEGRLRDGLRQLAEGVEALHQSGKLHRDIKPTNVLVTPEGRVVLLDFGLTADLEASGRHRTIDRQVVGTVAHMSPEQAAGLSINPASDWYSVGVMLYEALTGRLPFVGPPADVIVIKQTTDPDSPATLVEDLPEDLVRLCVELLDRDPTRRPAGRDVITRLTGQLPDSADRPEPRRSLPLIGRARHLQILDLVFGSLSQGQTQSIFVFGRTGTGKTTLIRSFLDGLSVHEEAVVVSGRCYERESVPYKALDSLIDALARHLKGLPRRKVAALLAAGRGLPGPGLPGDARGGGRGRRAADVVRSARSAGGAAAGLRRAARAADSAGEEGPAGPGDRRPPVGRRGQRGPAVGAALLAGVADPAVRRHLPLGGRREQPVPGRDPAVARGPAGAAGASRAGRRGARRCRRPASWRWRCWAATIRWRGPRRTWWPASRAVIRCSSTSWSSTSRAASRSRNGRRSASSTWTRSSGSGSAGSRRRRNGSWPRWRSRGGRSPSRWPSRRPSSGPAAACRWPRSGPPG